MSLGAQVDGVDASASGADRQESEDAPQHQERSLVAPISLCLICKDNISTLERCIRSARPFVAETCVFDTGSTDGTLELLDSLASEPGTPIRIERGEWRNDFAWARNQSFAMADSALPWRMYLDSDDEMVAGEQLVEVVREMERTNDYGAVLAYYYDFAATGDEGEVSPFLRLRERTRLHQDMAGDVIGVDADDFSLAGLEKSLRYRAFRDVPRKHLVDFVSKAHIRLSLSRRGRA